MYEKTDVSRRMEHFQFKKPFSRDMFEPRYSHVKVNHIFDWCLLTTSSCSGNTPALLDVKILFRSVSSRSSLLLRRVLFEAS